MTKQEKLDQVHAYMAMGKTTISPTQAAPILGCAPYGLNIGWRNGNGPKGGYFFSGRNLRISLSWLENFLLGGVAD